jgi:hypothetical protein
MISSSRSERKELLLAPAVGAVIGTLMSGILSSHFGCGKTILISAVIFAGHAPAFKITLGVKSSASWDHEVRKLLSLLGLEP